MPVVEIDAEEAARKALEWYRSNGYLRTKWNDPDYLESAVNLSIAKALKSYDPERNNSLLAWLKTRISWDIADAVRRARGGRRNRFGEITVLRLSTIEGHENITPDMRPKPDTVYHQEILEKVKLVSKSERETQIILNHYQGKSYKVIGAELGISESRVFQLIPAIKKRLKDQVRFEIWKDCSRCFRILPGSSFWIDRRTRTGLRSECRVCLKAKPRVDMGDLRECRTCGLKIHKSHFHKRKNTPRGCAWQCKECSSKRRSPNKWKR